MGLGDIWGAAKKYVPGIHLGSALYDKATGQGTYAPPSTAQLQQDNDRTRALRDQFAAAYSNNAPTAAPTTQAATINTTQSNQARGIQGQGLETVAQGIGTQGLGAGIQVGGLATQAEGIGAQRSALDVQRGAVDTQREGVNAQRGALNTQQDAANSYRNVLTGNTPSVAEMTGRRLAGDAVAAGYGGAAGASGGNRSLALRTAINGAGAIGAQSAANAAIGRASEQDVARQGLLNAGTAQSGTGAAITGAGSQIAGTGAGIANTGQGITAGGQGISATGAGVANTGAGIVGSGATQTGIGTAIRGQDIDVANHQADLTQGAGVANLGAAVANRGQDIAQEQNRGSLALGGTTAATNADTNQINQIRQNNADQNKNTDSILSTGGDLLALSDERVKANVAPAQPSQVSALFRSLVGSSADDSPQMMASDERVKTGKQVSPGAARDMFSQLVPKTWKYDTSKLAAHGIDAPDTEGDEHLGLTAQNVESTGKLGRGMVKNVRGVKAIDIPMAVSALMAAVADIERRHGASRG